MVPDSGVNTMGTLDDSASGATQYGFGRGKKQSTKKPVFTKRWKPIICWEIKIFFFQNLQHWCCFCFKLDNRFVRCSIFFVVLLFSYCFKWAIALFAISIKLSDYTVENHQSFTRSQTLYIFFFTVCTFDYLTTFQPCLKLPSTKRWKLWRLRMLKT